LLSIEKRLVKSKSLKPLLIWLKALYVYSFLVDKEETHFGFFKFRTVEVVRVQCKVAWLSKDGSYIAFNTHKLTNRLTKKVSYHGIAEWFGVYSPDTGKVYMVAVSESRKGSDMKLRLHPTKNNQEKNVNWARDYLRHEADGRTRTDDRRFTKPLLYH
jgi:PD-(D/E)XK endonuclease